MLRDRIGFLSIWIIVFVFWALPALAAVMVDTAWAGGYSGMRRDDEESFNIGLQMIRDFEKLPYPKDFVIKHYSSYDRSGGNDDCGNFLNGPYNHCKYCPEGCLLVEADGPGVITRIWHTADFLYNARFNIYLDNDSVPVISCKRDELFHRELCFPFVDLFVGDADNSACGFYSYFPIPFAEHIKITATEILDYCFFYNVDYLLFPAGTSITSFSESLSQKDEENSQSILNTWHNLGSNPISDSNCTIIGGTVLVRPNETDTMAYILGAHSIIDMKISFVPPYEDTLKDIIFKVYWDGEKHASVDVPLSAFFGNGIRRGLFSSLPLGSTQTGFYSYFPLPFYSSAWLQIENRGIQDVFLNYQIAYRDMEPGELFYKFHAQWREENPTTTDTNYVMLAVNGTGHYVGTTLNINSDHDWSILEGDEMFYVDGETEPIIHGTGTEDYFNAGWYFCNRDSLQLPYHGLSWLDYDSSGLGNLSAYRFHIPDIVPFKSSLKATFEHGPTNNINANYSSVAYYYLYECPMPIPGNANCDGSINVGDVVFLIDYLYKNGSAPPSLETADVNCDRMVDIGDVVFLINYLFKGGPAPNC